MALHGREKVGVLLVNTGTPSAPESKAVKRYLAQFLMDKHIAPMNRFIWWFILHLAILPKRSVASAEKYRKIWTPEGSPLLVTHKALAAALEARLESEGFDAPVRIAMNYGEPPIKKAFREFRELECDRIVVLLGGRVAEQLEFDDISTGASNDLQRATKLAHDMIAKYGMNERIGAVAYDDDSEIFVGRDYERTRSYSEQTAAEIDAEVRKTVDRAYAHCTQILTEHHEKLQEIAQWLLEHETMSRSQFEACMQALPIPEKQEGLLAGEEKTDGAEED